MDSIYFKQIEHRILQLLFCRDNEASTQEYITSEFAVNDVRVEYTNKVILGEFKFRNFNHNEFPDAWWMQRTKLVALRTLALNETKPVTIYYINFFKDGFLCIWDVTNIKPAYTTLRMKETTSRDFKHSGQQTYKQVFNLSINNTKLIRNISSIYNKLIDNTTDDPGDKIEVPYEKCNCL